MYYSPVQKDYRTVIKEGLMRRIALNAKYSLRAYARDTGVSFGQLSLIINGKKGISPQKADKLFTALDLATDEKRHYVLQVTREHARSSKKRKKASETLIAEEKQSSRHLTEDAFQMISDWHHLAILQTLSLREVLQQKTRSSQLASIEKVLMLSPLQVEVAVERLLRLDLIRIKNKLLVIAHDSVFTTEGVPSQAIRNFHAQMLKKASDALELQTFAERFSNSAVLPVIQEDLPALKNEIAQFQKKIIKKYGRAIQQDGEHVYGLSLQLFKITE